MRPSALALALLTSISLPVAAQGNPQTRQGFFISFGFGAGSLGCDECQDADGDDERVNGVNFQLRAGGTLSQRLLIGGEVNGFTKSENDATLTVTNIGPILQFYPSAQGGFFLKGGLGLATAEFEFAGLSVEDEGFGITLGLGFDARVGRNFALTPYFDILSSSFDGVNFNQVAIGLGFTWP
jgi:hypothetical protein